MVKHMSKAACGPSHNFVCPISSNFINSAKQWNGPLSKFVFSGRQMEPVGRGEERM